MKEITQMEKLDFDFGIWEENGVRFVNAEEGIGILVKFENLKTLIALYLEDFSLEEIQELMKIYKKGREEENKI